MKELEKHLQIGLQRFLDLKKVLDSFQEEIEYSDDSINGFIQSIIPDFHSWAINAEAEENVDNKPNNQNKHDSSPSKEDTKEDISKNLVLPLVNYEWIDVAPSKPPLYVKHLKRFTNSFSSRTEKLKLNIHFAGDSRHLPTKIHIEIRDCKGRVVFRKRQNVYYVKLQEEISTLSGEEDYVLTITSIYGPEKKSFETIIYNKNYVEELPPGSPEQLRSPSEASHTSGFDERSLDSALLSPFRVKEASVEVDSILITETPLPDLEDITGRAFLDQDKEEDNATDCDEANDLEEEILDQGDGTEGSRKNSFLLVKKLILPEVMY